MNWKKWLAVVTTVAATSSTFGALASPAGAAGTTTVPVPIGLSGSTTSAGVEIGVGAVLPLPPEISAAIGVATAAFDGWGFGNYGFGLDASSVDLKTEFAQAGSVDAGYTNALLSEGETLDVSDTVHPINGSVTVSATLHGNAGLFKQTDLFEWEPKWTGDITKTLDLGTALCVVPAPGEAPKLCDLDDINLNIIGVDLIPFVLGFNLAYVLDLKLEVDSTGFVTTREYHLEPAGPDVDQLSFATKTLADPYDISCSSGGNDLAMVLDDSALSVDSSIPATLKYVLNFNIVGQTVEQWVLAQRDLGELDFAPALLEADPPSEVTLGTVAEDNKAPVVTAASSFAGDEGSPINFSATVSDACLGDNVKWEFSDGTSEFGTTVQKTFNENGPYTGRVIATDSNGNTTIKNFTVSVANLAPIGYAGADTTSLWGVAVPFHAYAVDPSSVDQANLHYTWTFGDGTPSTSDGPDVSHVYAAAGDYTAQLFVCDDEGMCGPTDSRVIHVTKRQTAVAYTGARSAPSKKTASVSASVVDELLQPVPGRTVKFTVGPDTISAVTGANGVAVATLKNTLLKGSYTMTAQLVLPAGEARYITSSDSVSFNIGK
jgi:hypothetical protein